MENKTENKMESKKPENSKFVYEDPAKIIIPEEEKKQIMKEIEEIIETVPYNLGVVLIKVSLLNQYTPLPIEKYYDFILPTFHLLRRPDGTKYTSRSMNTLRAGMFSTRLFFKNDDGLFMLNLRNALTHLKLLQKRKLITDTESKKVKIESTEKEEKQENKEEKENDDDIFIRYELEDEASIKKLKSMLGKKRW